jgi:hypothetical protein
VYWEFDASTYATKATDVPATPVASTWVIPTWTLSCPPVRSEDKGHPYTVEWYTSTEPASPTPGSLKMWGVEVDQTFGEFQRTIGVVNFVNDSGFLTKLYPANHPLWESCLTDDMCKRNGILDYVLTGARLSFVLNMPVKN